MDVKNMTPISLISDYICKYGFYVSSTTRRDGYYTIMSGSKAYLSSVKVEVAWVGYVKMIDHKKLTLRLKTLKRTEIFDLHNPNSFPDILKVLMDCVQAAKRKLDE